MELHPHAQSLGTQLGRFNTRQLLYFSLTLTERALPFYLHFARIANIGDPDQVAAHVASTWDSYDLSSGPYTVPKVKIPENWDVGPQELGKIAGETINHFADFLETRSPKIVQQQATKMLELCAHLEQITGESAETDEIRRQKQDMTIVRNLVEDDPLLLTEFITDALENASMFSNTYLTRLI